MVLRQLNASEAEAQLYGRLADSIYSALLRADTSTLISNHRGQSGLGRHFWRLADGAVANQDLDNIELVRQLVKAHATGI